MADIRSRLADALREAAVDRTSSVIDRQVDALLSTPGIAIVELPDFPKLSDRWRTFVRLNPTNARDWAVQILALAAAVQTQQGR